MKKLRLLFSTIILLLITTCHAYSTEFKNIVVFGDSLSDNGNLFAIHDEYPYPPAPYYQGRVSDGPVWSEYLAEELGFTGIILNYAQAGAQSGRANNNGDFPGFLDEVDTYLSVASTSIKYSGAFALPKDTLFIIWIGSNDFSKITDPVAQITQASSNIQSALLQLIEAGGSKFMFINVPDLGKTPRSNKDVTISYMATQLATEFNMALEQVLSGVEEAYPNISIGRFDSFSMLSDTIDNSAVYGFTNTSDSKLNMSDGTISEGIYLFWDDIHPTTFTHRLFAKNIAKNINCETCKGNMTPYFENDLTLKVPSARLGNDSYGFTLVPYANPAEEGVFWSLDINSIKANNN